MAFAMKIEDLYHCQAEALEAHRYKNQLQDHRIEMSIISHLSVSYLKLNFLILNLIHNLRIQQSRSIPKTIEIALGNLSQDSAHNLPGSRLR